MNVIDCIILAGIGILTVFAVLFALSILIRLISFTVHLQTPWKKTRQSFSVRSRKHTASLCSQYLTWSLQAISGR